MNRERKIYDLLEDKLADFHYDGIPEEEFNRRWDDYLKEIGAERKGSWPNELRGEQPESGLVCIDPLYGSSSYKFIVMDETLVVKILTLGLP